MSSRVGIIHRSQPRIGVGTSSNYGMDAFMNRNFRQRRLPSPARPTQRGAGIGRRLPRRRYKKRNPKRYRSTKYQLR